MVYLFTKKVRGKQYYYLGENKWVNGQSRRIWESYLGSAEHIKSYFEEGCLPTEVESLSYGIPGAALTINAELDFVKTVNNHCHKRNQGLSVGDHVLIDIINRLDDQKSHNKLGKWFSKTILRRQYKIKESYLSSQGYWNHWQYFNEKKIAEIQKTLLPQIIQKIDIKQLFYDPTNFTTYIADNHKDAPRGKKRHKADMAQYGKSKTGLKGLRQINLALLVTKDYGIPLWHSVYEGNINDVTFFKTFITSMVDKVELFTKHCKAITLIFDKGNNSKISLKRVGNDLHFYMLGSLSPSQYKELLQIHLNEFTFEYVNAKDNVIKAHALREEVFGKKMQVVITYNERTAYKQRLRVKKALAKAHAYLKKVQQKRLNQSKWTQKDKVLIRINNKLSKINASQLIKWNLIEIKDKKGDYTLQLTYEENEEYIDYKKASYGKTIIFTDNDSLKPVEVVKAYHDKYIVEEAIKRLKNKHIISYAPSYKWTDNSHRVHAFTCVMALLFMAMMKKKVEDEKIKISEQDMIDTLKEIRLSLLLSPKGKKIIPKVEKMDDLQKQLYKLFELEKVVL